MDKQQLIARAEALVKDHMAKYDPSHDWAHVNRVRRTSMRIAKTFDEPPDMLVVELTALFHDMAGKHAISLADSVPKASTDQVDAKYGDTSCLNTLLEPFFTTSGLPADQVDLILRIIPCISYSTETKMLRAGDWTEWHQSCSELRIVQDADRLDAIGAIGVLRCSAYSGAKGRTLLGKGEGVETAEQHFYDKLLNVKDRMKTPAGRAEAEKRQQHMLDFLRALDVEEHPEDL